MSVSMESYLVDSSSELETEGLENRVFLGWSGVLNSLNDGRSLGPAGRFEDKVSQVSPFPEGSREIGHQIVVDDTFDEDAVEKHLESGLEDAEIDYESGGELYQVTLDEVFEPGSEVSGRYLNDIGKFDNKGLKNSGINMDMLNVHMICYESPEGEKNLVHWDPGFYDEEGVKHKYIASENGITTESSPVSFDKDFFIDESNYSLDEGLSEIVNNLDSLGEKYLELAGKGENEKAYEAFWMGKRWKQMSQGLEKYQKFLNNDLGSQSYI